MTLRANKYWCRLLVLALMVSQVAVAEPVGDDNASVLGYDKLSVTVSTPKAVLLPSEPLGIDVTVENRGQVPSVLVLRPLIEHYGLDLFFKKPDSGRWQHFMPLCFVDATMHADKVQPGSSLRSREILTYCIEPVNGRNTAVFLLETAGTYVFRAEFTPCNPEAMNETFDKKNTIVTNEVTVEVREPEGDEIKALALWRELLKLGRGVEVEGPIWEHRTEFGELVRKYPDSVFADYVNFFIPHETRIVLPQEHPDVPLCVYYAQLLEPVVADREFAFRDEAMIMLAQHYASMTPPRAVEAAALLDEVIAEMPDSPFIEKARKHREGVEITLEHIEATSGAGTPE